MAKGQNRLLLVMATGTGKTYTAFQIIWRLWKAKRKKRVLFLVDRNVLADKTMVNDFRPFSGAMAKLSTGSKVIEREDGSEFEIPLALDNKRRIDTAYETYEQLLNDLQSTGNAGEFYTPRAVTAFMVERIDPKPGEVLLDPACGTGGFLSCAVRHMRSHT